MSHTRFSSRFSIEERDLQQARADAAEFLRVKGVQEGIGTALNELVVQRPGDVHGFLADYFSRLSEPARISRICGRELYDASAQPYIQAQVFCVVCNKEKSSSAAVSRCLTPTDTWVDGNADSQERSDDVLTAERWINEPLNDMLRDQNPCDQSQIDRILSDFFMARVLEENDVQNKEKQEVMEVMTPSPPPKPAGPDKQRNKKDKKDKHVLEKGLPPAEPVLRGSAAIGSLSLAVAKTGAQVQGIPLYKYIAALKSQKVQEQFHMPVCLVTLLCCGKTSPGKLSLLEEIILIPKAGQSVKQTVKMAIEIQKEMMRIMKTSTKAGASQAVVYERGAPAGSYERPEQPLDLITQACRNLGLALGAEVHLVLNCTAPKLMDYSKGKYEVAAGVFKSPDELVDMYKTLISSYPAVVALIDPFRREDPDQWRKFSDAAGDSCLLLSDITYKPHAPPPPGVRGHILKHINETTVSDVLRVTSENSGSVLMGTTSNGSCGDDSLSDIVVGLGLDYVKLGGLSGAERMTKYNRLISIEEELAQQGILVCKEKRAPPLFPGDPAEESTTTPDTAGGNSAPV
ncbi:enolase 4 [Cololabis saira]|uniref:enolase 4 n=1 Tax=Cololabis saira TaxID=129043 RepID=UPI002AD4D873|nr:enolase 4 [Cololabis saira]